MKTKNKFLQVLNEILFGRYSWFLPPTRRSEIARRFESAAILTLAAMGYADLSPELVSRVGGWHKSILQQIGNVQTLKDGLIARESTLPVPLDYKERLTKAAAKLADYVTKSAAGNITANERHERNSLLKATVGFCLHTVRPWVYGEYAQGNLTVDDVHELGFLLPGETGGNHELTDPTDIMIEVKSQIISGNIVRIIFDQASVKNAGPVLRGWAPGTRMARLVIYAVDGHTEVVNMMTTHLHNDIVLPEDCHGKQFLVRATFLKHVNDEPRWSNEVTFSMPLTTGDLARAIDQQHYEDYEASLREVERHRQEIEKLHAELEAARANRGGEGSAS
ncbi:MAG: hypothetical protein LBI96_00220 [Odoribacteraceae bacterium]|jgi:hypothetical protein|nr:hypothetical protein [Odoribacteraceae bacterium]